MKVNKMNKKVMVLFTSAVLTASLAGTGCAYTRDARLANVSPLADQAVTQEATGDMTVINAAVNPESLVEFHQEKLAEEVMKAQLGYSGPRNIELELKLFGKAPANKSASKKTEAKKNSVSKKNNSKKTTASKKHSVKKASNHKKITVKKSYKLNNDVKSKIEKIKKAAAKKAAAKKAAQKKAEKARKSFFKKMSEKIKKAAQKKAAQKKIEKAKKAAKKAAQKIAQAKKAAKKAAQKKIEQAKKAAKKAAQKKAAQKAAKKAAQKKAAQKAVKKAAKKNYKNGSHSHKSHKVTKIAYHH